MSDERTRAKAAAIEALSAAIGELSSLVELSASDKVQAQLEQAREALAALRGDAAARPVPARAPEPPPGVDPARLLNHAAKAAAGKFVEAGMELQLIVPARLARTLGDEKALEAVLIEILKRRAGAAVRGAACTLTARHCMPRHESGVLISIIDPPACVQGTGGDEVVRLRELVEPLGGRVAVVVDAELGCATTFELPTL